MTLDHHDEATAHAMRVVARGLIAEAVSEYLRSPTWLDDESFDDTDAIDLTRITLELTPPPDEAEHAAAVEHLTKRGQR